MNIKQILELNPFGFTIKISKNKEPVLMNLKTGYIVSITDNKIDIKDIESEFIKLLKLGNLLNLETFYIGFWDNTLDISICTSRLNAVLIGNLFNQKAIYDNFEQRVFTLEGNLK